MVSQIHGSTSGNDSFDKTCLEVRDNGIEKAKSKRCIKSKQILLLIAFGYCNFAMGCGYALLAPFFPREAEAKGASPTIYGLIIGFYQLIVIVLSPICGKLAVKLTPALLSYGGVFLSGWAQILFGVLEWCPPGTTFITFAFLVRCFDAVGWACFFTCSYAIVAMSFSENRATMLALMETLFGVGLIIGPTIGGALYQVGGYAVPFVTMGSILLVGSFFTFMILPPTGKLPQGSPGTMKKLLTNPSYLIDLLVCISCMMAIGFNDATLEPHLRQFGLQPVVVGTIFIALGGIYAICSPLWGYLCDKWPNTQILCAIGITACIVGFLFIGPVPFIPIPTTLWLVIIAQIFLGLGTGGKLICAFYHAMKQALFLGLPDDVSTHGIVFGTVTSASSIGSFLGPSLGGLLLDMYGYENATVFVVGIEFVIGIIVWMFAIVNRKKVISPEEDISLLRKE